MVIVLRISEGRTTTTGTAETIVGEQAQRRGSVKDSQLGTSHNFDESLHHDAVVLAVIAEADAVPGSTGVVESRRNEKYSNTVVGGHKTEQVTNIRS